MNQQKIAIVVDSGCDVPEEWRKRYGMYLLPLRILYEQGEYLDGVEISSEEVYQRLPQEIPKTSLPSGGQEMCIRDSYDYRRLPERAQGECHSR